MVELAETIIERMSVEFDPTGFHDRYQDALRALVEAKVKGAPKPRLRAAEQPSNVVDLMAALKASLERNSKKPAATRAKQGDRRQGTMLLPVKGGGRAKAAEAAPVKGRSRKKA
jgi:DNA end-binding protein Ku